MDWLGLLPYALGIITVIFIVAIVLLDIHYKKRIKKVKYPIPSMDHAVDVGLLDCEQCRNKEACHEIYPQAFPDIERKCSANFMFMGTHYHYTLEDINHDLKQK